MNLMSNDRQVMRSFSQSYSSPSSASASSSQLPGHGLRLDEGCSSRSPNNGGDEAVIEREHMFDKVVTPSDVGKLNRLVIPKQHAEKYFPLDSSTSDKGLLLSFEDSNGRPWRFRYSYWNSSQSYVMTKGWSRFVKDKKLDAGDIVSFHRGIGESGKDRLFIDWRRRSINPHPHLASVPAAFSFHHRAAAAAAAWNYHAMFLPPQVGNSHSHSSYGYNNYAIGCSGPNNYPFNSQFNTAVVTGNPCIYVRSGPEEVAPPALNHHQTGGGESGAIVFESVPVVQGKTTAAAKRLRLFGVNMDCPVPESDPEDCDISSSAALIPSSSSDLDSPIDKAKTRSSMSLDFDI